MERNAVIAIAHRLSTMAPMHRLIVINQITIMEIGTHDELLCLGGHYGKPCRHQSSGYLVSTCPYGMQSFELSPHRWRPFRANSQSLPSHCVCANCMGHKSRSAQSLSQRSRMLSGEPGKPSIRPPRLFLYFHAVTRHGSIRKAAEQLFVASSALNRHILELERQLGTALFERLPQGVRLTAAGEIFHHYVRGALSGLESACLQIDDLRGLVRGRVRIAATETVSVDLLPRAIAEFHRHHPGVRFELMVAPSQAVASALSQDDADLMFALNPPSNPEMSVIARLPQPTCALMAPSHPLARRKQISLAECLGYPVILPSVGMGGRTLLDQALGRSSVCADPVLVSNSLEAMKGMARNSQAICFQLLMGTRRDSTLGELVAIPLTDPEIDSGTVILASRHGRTLPVAATAFVETLKGFLSTL